MKTIDQQNDIQSSKKMENEKDPFTGLRSLDITCPVCKSHQLTAKYEAKYVYSYIMDADAPGKHNEKEFLPFLYDNREQTEANQYIECNTCGTRYPCYFTSGCQGVDFKVLKDATRGQSS